MQNSLTKQLYGGIMKMKKEMDIMLLEFSCSNYKSIMNKVTFSFLASKDDPVGGIILLSKRFGASCEIIGASYVSKEEV